MASDNSKTLQLIADTVRVISAEGVEKANSGHPGLPMGCAEIGAALFAKHLSYNPKNPNWLGRDRFVLSAGHGSMFLYSCLHISGYDLSMDDIKAFRQPHSKTPGHPEFRETAGVETTTGPLGQGIAAASGMALANKMLAAQFGPELFEGKVYVLCGDGCLMEGISGEASSLAGTMGLNNLVVIYDSNDICLDGPTSECFTEDVAARYVAYGWKVLDVDGHDIPALLSVLAEAKAEAEKPVMIIAKTIIGKGSPAKQGTNNCHGAPLGAAELELTKKAIGWTEEPFTVPVAVKEYFAAKVAENEAAEAAWNAKLAAMKADAAKAALWEIYVDQKLPADFDDQIWNMPLEPGKATRVLSQSIIAKVAELVPFFVSGSADLSHSDNTFIKGANIVNKEDYTGQLIKFGVREFAMAAACYGMRLGGMIQPLCGTFFTFSDYMKNAVRLAALMKVRVLFQWTHDTILLGEDGPTHQPVEHMAGLRAMPGLSIFRPADENETKAMWIQAMKAEGPVGFILSRQNMADMSALTSVSAREGVAKGAYLLCGSNDAVDVAFYATGSEVGLALQAAELLKAQGKSSRVISMPCWELFDAQDEAYKASILDAPAKLRVSVEAASEMGWHKYIGRDGIAIAVNSFGASAPAKSLAVTYGFTPQQVADRVLAGLAAK